MMVALWAGSLVLAFFGVTLAALRVAGGFVVALTAWELLNQPEHREARKQEQAACGRDRGHRTISDDHSDYHGSGHDGGRSGA